MAEFENPFADPESQNLFHVSSFVSILSALWSFGESSVQIYYKHNC